MVVLDALVVADGRVGDIGLGRAAGGGGGGSAVPGARPRPLGVSLGPEARDRERGLAPSSLLLIQVFYTDQYGMRFLLKLISAEYMFCARPNPPPKCNLARKDFCCVLQKTCLPPYGAQLGS